jgi:hypothetical protein
VLNSAAVRWQRKSIAENVQGLKSSTSLLLFVFEKIDGDSF